MLKHAIYGKNLLSSLQLHNWDHIIKDAFDEEEEDEDDDTVTEDHKGQGNEIII